jgi:hypothetical protein
MAADPTSWCRPVGAGLALGNDAESLIAVVGPAGAVDPAAAIAVARAHPAHTLLIDDPALAAAVSAPDRRAVRALLHTLVDPARLPELEGAAPLPRDELLPHVPQPLAAELARARARGPVWAAWLDGEPAAFAYAPARSARWFDVSVDTLPAARQLGLGAIVAVALIRAERAAGREPVWGATDDNPASLRLAARLGFAPVDELWVVLPVAEPSRPAQRGAP